MTLAVKDAILSGISFEDAMVKWGRAYPDAGYGGSFFRWIFADNPIDPEVWNFMHPGVEQKTERKPYGSYGNGSAMRVSYIGQYLKNDNDVNHVIELATQSAQVTHNHPEGIKGAVVTAVCVWMAERGASKQEILDYAISEYPSSDYEFGYDISIEKYHDQMRFRVSCMDTVPVAIRCFFETDNFSQCQRLINSMECDADTIGAISGGIMESFHGCCYSKVIDKKILKFYLPNDLFDLAMR